MSHDVEPYSIGTSVRGDVGLPLARIMRHDLNQGASGCVSSGSDLPAYVQNPNPTCRGTQPSRILISRQIHRLLTCKATYEAVQTRRR